MTANKLRRFLRIALLTVLLLVGASLLEKPSVEENFTLKGKRLGISMAMKGYRIKSMNHSVGYTFEMLKQFTEAAECMDRISLQENSDSCLVPLFTPEDSIDIVVMPISRVNRLQEEFSRKMDSVMAFADSSAYALTGEIVLPDSISIPSNILESVSLSLPLADSTVWAVRKADDDLLKEINIWVATFTPGKEHKELIQRFSPNYNPYTRALSGNTYNILSPYDGLIRKYAAIIGWDWRMLAALVWKESAFRIEAISPKGAEGLMQMIPSTASKYSADNMLDPEENLKAATSYLKKLTEMFEPYAADSMELMKFALAAYNAGEGRIKDCIALAESKGMPTSTWLEVEAVFPYLRDDSILEDENVRLGKFQGFETMEYIREMQALYWSLCLIAPGQSSPDRLSIRTGME